MAFKEFGISVPLPESFPKVSHKDHNRYSMLTSTQVVTALQRDPERLALLLLSFCFGVTNTTGRA